MGSMGRALIDDDAIVRSRFVDQHCPERQRTGTHNWVDARHWFRRYRVCASCGYVLQVPG